MNFKLVCPRCGGINFEPKEKLTSWKTRGKEYMHNNDNLVACTMCYLIDHTHNLLIEIK